MRVEKHSVGTIGEFLDELQSVRTRFHWVLESDRGWRAERRGQARRRVRAYPKEGPGEHVGLDPIGAVCYAATNTLYRPEFWQDAAQTLGLPLLLASHLTAAADDRTWHDVEGQRKPDKQLLLLRDQLIDLLRLRQV